MSRFLLYDSSRRESICLYDCQDFNSAVMAAFFYADKPELFRRCMDLVVFELIDQSGQLVSGRNFPLHQFPKFKMNTSLNPDMFIISEDNDRIHVDFPTLQ